MRSLPVALMWEYWRFGRWGMLTVTLAMIVMPTFIYHALNMETSRTVDFTEEGFHTLHFSWYMIQLFCFGAAAIGGQVKAPRLYALPVGTWSLVAWRMLPALVSSAAMFLINYGALRVLINYNWPIAGPLLFLLTSLAVIQSVLWLGGRSQLGTILLVAVTGGLLGLWLQWRYNGAIRVIMGKVPAWSFLTLGDWLTTGAAFATAMGMGYVGVARDRRGAVWDTTWLLRLFAWLLVPLDWLFVMFFQARPSGQAVRVQTWFEWRTKGLLLPGICVSFALAVLPIWTWQGFPAGHLITFLGVSGYFLSVIALVMGMVMGHCGSDKEANMGTFMATRPISDGDFAAAILRSTARGILLTWGLWVTVLLVTLGVLFLWIGPEMLERLLQVNEPHVELQKLPLLALGSPLVAWIVCALTLSIVLTGRPQFFLPVICGSFAAGITWMVLLKWVIPAEVSDTLNLGMLHLVAIALFFGTIALYVVARKKLLIGPRLPWIALCVWMALAATLPFIRQLAWHPQNHSFPVVVVPLLGLFACAVAPLAAAPLALSWNRHR